MLSAGKGWAKVVSIIDENNRIGFEVREGEKPYLGVCQGDGDGMLSGNLLDEEGFASEGDRVYTSGLGGIYPAGLVIGTVTKAEFTKDSTLMTIEIEPSAYFKGLRKVLVVL